MMEIQTEPTRGIVEYLKLNIPLFLTSEAKQKWIRYVNANSNSAEGIKVLSDVANMLFKVKKGEDINKLENELAKTNPNKDIVLSIFRSFSDDVLVDLNKPTYQEDYDVTAEVPEDEKIIPFEEVTKEVPEEEEIEPKKMYDKNKITNDFLAFAKEDEDVEFRTSVFQSIIRSFGSPCEDKISSDSDIVEYNGKKTTKRDVFATKLKEKGFDDLSNIVLEDPQKQKDLELLNDMKRAIDEKIEIINSNNISKEVEEKFNNKYVDEEGKPIKLPKM
ncbi:MAG: hypothetical protein J5970_02595 [Bacilli bacterium]|nr:hypothetical protein [Bacilli bacterium]